MCGVLLMITERQTDVELGFKLEDAIYSPFNLLKDASLSVDGQGRMMR
jgi:hypothetical protein